MRLLSLLLSLFLSTQILAEVAYDGSLMRQATVLSAPKAGTVSGSLSSFDTGVEDRAAGSLTYTLPLDFRTERAPLLAAISPTYSMQQGLSEWGLGWQMNLSIKRVRILGHINYRDDLFSSPWGLLAKGADGYWYPEGLKSRMRVRIEPKSATVYGPDGETYLFNQTVETALGTYAYYLSEVRNVTGRKTFLNYESTKNLVYLKSVRYGGSGEHSAYSIDFIYENLDPSRHWISFKSKFSQVNDRVIKRIVHRLGSGTILWTYEIEHEFDALSPLHFLKSVSRVFPGGAREPAIVFSYEKFEAEKVRYEKSDRLDSVAELGLDADRLAFYDYNNDGLIDLENSLDHSLYLQGAKGFQLYTRFAAETQNVCLGANSSLNRARQVMRIRGLETEPMVVHSDRAGNLTFCELDGTVKAKEQFAFRPELHRNALLVDLNGDQKPDLYHLKADGYAVYANQSSSTAVSFALEKYDNHKPTPSLSSLWASDINGDGMTDIAIVGGSTLKVYMGKGDFEFTPTFLSMPIEREDGSPFDPTTYTPTFTDVNQDGLADILLTEGKSLYTFINSGRSFKRLKLDTFEMLSSEGAVFTQNILGSGEQIIFRSGSGGVRAARLNRANTNLLRSIDDGRGTRLAFSYDFHSAEGTRFSLEKILSTISVRRSMEGETVSNFSYQEPYYRSGSPQRLAFSRVTMQDALSEEVAEFDNRDFTSVLRSTSERSFAFPSIFLKKRWTYTLNSFQGLPNLLRDKDFVYFYDARNGQTSDALTSEVLSHDPSLCESKVRKSREEGTYSIAKTYLNLAGKSLHLLCLPEAVEISEESGFFYRSQLAYNEALQIKQFELIGRQSKQLMQTVSYDELFRVKAITAADGTFKNYSYLDDSDMLTSVSDSSGVELSRDGLNERDLFTIFSTGRGSLNRYTQHAAFDTFDRLGRSWDSLFGSPESPLAQLNYRWPTLTAPGQLLNSATNLQGGRTSQIGFVSGSGQTIGRLIKNADENWLGLDLQELLPSEATTRQFAKTVVAPSQVDSIFGEIKNPIATMTQGAFGFGLSSARTVQDGVEMRSTLSLSVQNGALISEELINSRRVKKTGFNSDLQKVFEIDGEKNRSDFTYDTLGRLKSLRLASAQSMDLLYDDLGRLEEVRSARAGIMRYRYNSMGLVEKKSHLDGSGQIVYEQVMAYDGQARPMSLEAEAGGRRTSYQYTYDGRMPDGTQVANQLGFLSSVGSGPFVKTFIYDLKGRIQEQSLKIPELGLHVRKDMEHDALDRPVSLAIEASTAGAMTSYRRNYEYDTLARLETIQMGAGSIGLRYNDLNELDSLSGAVDVSYVNDSKTGRRLGFRSSGDRSVSLEMAFSAYDEVESESYKISDRPADLSFDYDNRGFLQNATGLGNTESFAYSPDGLMNDKAGADALFSMEGGPAYEFDRIGRMSKRGSTRINYGSIGQAESIVNENGSFSIVYDEGQKPLLIFRSGKLYYLKWEGLTFVNGHWYEPLTVGSHIVGWMRDGRFEAKSYDLRGTMVGDSPTSPYGQKNLAGSSVVDFAGHPYIPEIGLVSMGARFYDPELGQFITPDAYFFENPAAGVNKVLETNLYTYGVNNPLSYSDPTGKWAVVALGFGAALATDFFFNPEVANSPGRDGNIDTSMPPETKFGLAIAGTSLLKSGNALVGSLPSNIKAWLSKPLLEGAETGALKIGSASTSYADFNQARNAALKWLEERGFKAESPSIGKFGANQGRPIGMKMSEKNVGYRVEFDERNGAHINVWAGKEKGPHFRFEGSESQVNKIVKQFEKSRP